jgi:hypothetical protein
MRVYVPAGVATAVGSLPHRDADAAAAFVLDLLPDLPAVPSLPSRSPAERILAHGLVGVRGVTIDDGGDVRLDVDRLDPLAAVTLDLDHDSFGGLRAFLRAAAGREDPVKWQVVGPVTLGLALARRGAPPALAFDVAVRAIREHLRTVRGWVAEALPGCTQIAVIDEPGFSGVMDPGFPVPPDTAIDLASGALAAIEQYAVMGVHCCGPGDWAAIAATGPTVLSVPAEPALVAVSGLLSAFLDGGGWIAWGAVPTDRPVGTSSERHWRALSDVWDLLERQGCDATRLRQQALVTPACGLGLHDVAQAAAVLRMTAEIGERVQEQATGSLVPADR